MTVSQAVVFFLYPVAGLLGEVCFPRKQIMIAGTVLSLIGIVITVPTATVSFMKIFIVEVACLAALFITCCLLLLVLV